MAAVTETRHLGVPMPADLRERLQELADANDRSAAAEARQAIREYVERAEQREAKAS